MPQHNDPQVSIYLGNWRHALNDALAAVECDSSNVKAFFRGARAAAKLGELDKCLDMCERGSALGNAGEFEKIGREARRAAEAATAREQRAAREREEKQAPSR